MELFKVLVEIKSTQEALYELQSLCKLTPKIALAIDKAKEFHKDQFRKSGIPYVVHPICVACIVAFYGGDEAMICSALLHDVVEDTLCEISYIYENFGDQVGDLVDALTKIVEIRKEELVENSNEKLISQAMSFRKMLIASVKDARVLVIKISDRLHNMLTLDALSTKKQIRISEETLVVYAPIAHRLGISSLKNELEDLSFYYIFPEDYNKIQNYTNNIKQSLELKLHEFKENISTLLLEHGFLKDDFEIQGRVKRPYSIYLKMQRKGISIDEMLDLLAIRIICKESIYCYKILGIIHLSLKPIPSRIKDYIALPKENGYQTIHTTVFDKSSVYEVQIRTFDMHKSAEFGVAAHWKYKSGGISPDMSWLSNMQYDSTSMEEFYELATNDLYKEDLAVFSPRGDVFSLPAGAVALDFAYAVHSKIGQKAQEAYINHQKASLLQQLKNGDIVRIITSEDARIRCTWLDSVKTSKAKNYIRTTCQNKIKQIDKIVAINILATIFNKDHQIFKDYIKKHELEDKIGKASEELSYLRDLKNQIREYYQIDTGFFSKMKFYSLKLKEYFFDNLVIHTNRNINEVIFDYCCHPKFGDSIVAIKRGQKLIVHHKLCDKVNVEIQNGAPQVFIKWARNNKSSYKIIAHLEDTKGIMAEFLQTLAKYQCNVVGVSYEGYKHRFSALCEIIFETDLKDIKRLRDIVASKYKIVEFSSLKDAYDRS